MGQSKGGLLLFLLINRGRETKRKGGTIFGQKAEQKTEGRVCLRGEELGQNRKKRKEQGKTGKLQKRKKGKPEGAKFWRRREGQ
jgi:hypothetical protein